MDEDFLKIAVETAKKNVARGYYNINDAEVGKRSLAGVIRKRFGVLAELKHCSPTEKKLFQGDSVKTALMLEEAGASGISLITEPRFFGGSLEEVTTVKESVRIPVLMKDFVVDEKQVEAASRAGADALLLILPIFERGLARMGLDEAINSVHGRGLEVLLEVNTRNEFRKALRTEADLIGINSRNLSTLQVDANAALSILWVEKADRPVISMSGIKTREDVAVLKRAGASAVLVGTALHKCGANPAEKLRELTVIE